jgi:hypothetical protein
MQTMHPVTIFGSYMLDQDHIPPDEFEVRVRGAQAVMAERGWAGLIVHGDPVENAFLTYLTNYAPRTRAALALVPAEGDPCLLVTTSPRDIRREATIAWMDDVRMTGELEATLGTWFGEVGIGGGTIGLVNGGGMRPPSHRGMGWACSALGLEIADADAETGKILHAKRPREMVVARRASRILATTIDALRDAWKSGATATETVLAAEGVAFANQAQDARTLFSLDGGRTLRPFESPLPDRPDRLAAYVAVRYQAYWAEGFITLSRRRNKVQKAAHAALDGLIAAARPGATGGDLAGAAGLPGPFKPHAVTGASVGNGIGLSLAEAPDLAPGNEAAMVEDGIYSLRVGFSEGRRNHALVSAMVALGADEPEILWRAP